MSKNSTIIIGAGPAGLTTAYELNKLGKKSIILEADQLVGGISRTVNHNGNRFDIGGHRFFSKIPYVNEVWEDILQEDFLTRERLSRIHYKGHFFDYPLKPLNALSGLGPQEAVNIIFSYFKTKLTTTTNKEATNFEEWMVKRFGYRLYEIFFKTYTEKVWGMPCHEISADWASQRIKNFSLAEAIRGAFFSKGKSKNGEIITTLIEQFKYPKLGPGMMWETCQRKLSEDKNPTQLGTKVEQVIHKNYQVNEVIGVNKAGEQTSFSGDQFISSMPLRELILSLRPLPPNAVLEAAKKLKYRDYLTVVLVVNRKEVFPDNWIYVHTPTVKLGRIQNYKNWSPDMVNNPAYTTLGLEYFLWEKDEEWNWSSERLIEQGIRECQQINIIQANEVIDASVVKMKKAYPVYDHDYTKHLQTIKEYLGRFKNLQTVGRNGLHRYNNQDHSMLTGVYAARNIFGEQNDVWAVNTETDYLEENNINKPNITERYIPSHSPLT